MTSRQVLESIALLALMVYPAHVSAQSFHLLSQAGGASTSAAVAGSTGSDFDTESKSVASTGVIDLFVGAGASLPEVFASSTAHLQASLTSGTLTMSALLDSNGSVTLPEFQSAGGSGGVNLEIRFTVDAPVLVRMTGETTGAWTGDAGIEPGIALYSTQGFLADLNGAGGQIEYEGLLIPTEVYTLSGSGIASATTSEFNSFSSAQGGFTARLELRTAAVPEPGGLSLFFGAGIAGVCFFASATTAFAFTWLIVTTKNLYSTSPPLRHRTYAVLL